MSWLVPAVALRVATLAAFMLAFATFGPDSCSGSPETKPVDGVQLLLGQRPPLAPHDAREVSDLGWMLMQRDFDSSRSGAWWLLCATVLGLVLCAIPAARALPSIRLVLFPAQVWGLFLVVLGSTSLQNGPKLALWLVVATAVVDLGAAIANLVARRARPPTAATLPVFRAP